MVHLLVELVVLGVIAYLVESAPIEASFKIVIKVICIVLAILILLSAFGLADIPMPKLR